MSIYTLIQLIENSWILDHVLNKGIISLTPKTKYELGMGFAKVHDHIEQDRNLEEIISIYLHTLKISQNNTISGQTLNKGNDSLISRSYSTM